MYFIAVITGLTALITYLNYSTVPQIHALHDIYREFYYIPVLLGALLFGLKGAALSYLLILVLYLPYIIINWSGDAISEADKFLHILLQGIFGFLAGFLITRDKKRREQMEKERYLAGLGQAATTIVHDLKNPLITIQGFAKRLQEGKGKTEDAAQAIMDSANNMQKIVYDVLDFARPMKMAFRKEDIRNIIKRACDSCKTKTERWGIDILTDLPAEPVTIEIDSFNIERAVVNILNNAIEASARGQNISISTVAEKDYLTIRIKDQGAGMDSETIENIFIPFFTKKSWGTGLGMCISKKIIDGHEGKISINSNPGAGTEVTIKLPYRTTYQKK
jgi:signal transduction histidine kinase